MKKHRLLTTCALAAAVACCGIKVLASDRPQIDIPARARGAEKVVVARAASVTPRWRTNSFGDLLIISQVDLQVEQVLKGTPASNLSLDLEGGTIGDTTLRVSSLPELKPGERAVFFLDGTSEGSHVPHLKGLGILQLDANNRVRGSSLRLDDIRRMVGNASR